MPTPRVLIVSGSAGHGHEMAATAVHEALADRHPGIEVRRIDALEFMGAAYKHIYRRGYTRLVDKHPLIWRALYAATDTRSSSLGHLLTGLMGGALVREVQAWQPDLVLCTHFLAPELLSRALRKGRVKTQVHVVITDHDAHRVWYYPEVRRYYVASELVRARMVLRFGLSERDVQITGIPVRRAFRQPADILGVCTRFGLDPARPTVLFLSGGFAAGPMGQAILDLWRERPDVQMVAVCGRNVRLRRRISRLPRPAGAVLRALGFVKEVRDLMAASAVVVGKSGGSSLAESMAVGRPLIVSTSIPGQEERNAEALVEAGAGVRASTPEEIRWRVAGLLEDPAALEAMTLRARRFGRPLAALEIADGVATAIPHALAWRGPHFHGAATA